MSIVESKGVVPSVELEMPDPEVMVVAVGELGRQIIRLGGCPVCLDGSVGENPGYSCGADCRCGNCQSSFLYKDLHPDEDFITSDSSRDLGWRIMNSRVRWGRQEAARVSQGE